MNYYLLYFFKKYNGDWNKIYNALKYHELVSKESIESLKNDVLNNKIDFFTLLDENIYPKSFEKIKKAPFLMYFKGNIDLLKSLDISKKNEFCILDAKQYLLYGDIVEFLLTSGVKIILVLPCGFEINFIKNAIKSNIPDNLLIISEYPSNFSYTKSTQNRTFEIINQLKKQLYSENFEPSDNVFFKFNDLLENFQLKNIKNKAIDKKTMNKIVKK